MLLRCVLRADLHLLLLLHLLLMSTFRFLSGNLTHDIYRCLLLSGDSDCDLAKRELITSPLLRYNTLMAYSLVIAFSFAHLFDEWILGQVPSSRFSPRTHLRSIERTSIRA